MGQYHYPVNLDKREFLHPHKLGCGLKLVEQVWNNPGTAAALVILTAASSGRGGGDFPTDYPEVVGRWAGDRIAIVGDYADDDDLAPEHQASTIYLRCSSPEDGEPDPNADLFTDISALVAPVIENVCGGKYSGEGWRSWEESEAA